MSSIFVTVYTSKSIAPIDDKLIQEILQKSRKYNADHQITGCLIARNNYFLQLLEGPRDHVVKCLEKIEKDPRHTNILVQGEAYADERFMPEWSMGLITEAQNIQTAEEMLHLFDLGRDGESYSSSASLQVLYKIFSRGMKVINPV